MGSYNLLITKSSNRRIVESLLSGKHQKVIDNQTLPHPQPLFPMNGTGSEGDGLNQLTIYDLCSQRLY